jgi:TPP-dependent pyruvate/acetoin dehydrogenase alpha subunit
MGRDFDCIRQMRLWMIAINIASQEELELIDVSAKKEVVEGKKAAWTNFIALFLKSKRSY